MVLSDCGLRTADCGPAFAVALAVSLALTAVLIRLAPRLGLVDLCVAGACDLAVTPIGLATFGNLRALSRRNAEPAAASRPFDRARDGFVLGEGGVAFVLEQFSNGLSHRMKIIGNSYIS